MTVSRPSTFGIYPSPQTAPYAELAARARRVEEMGFDSIWVADETPMAYPGSLSLDAWTLLGALARETTRVRLGTLVSPVIFRHPLLTAMAVSTLDHVSDGRAILGIGAGGVVEDMEGVGQGDVGAAELVGRLDEQVEIIDLLLRGETVNRAEGWYQTREAVIEPPVQRPRPRILVAAQGRRTLGIAARRADIWSTIGGQPLSDDRVTLDEAVAETRRQVEILEAACAAAGRDPAAISRSVLAYRAGVYASRDAMAEWVGRFLEIGFDDFVLVWPGTKGAADPAREAMLERFAADDMPRLQSAARTGT